MQSAIILALKVSPGTFEDYFNHLTSLNVSTHTRRDGWSPDAARWLNGAHTEKELFIQTWHLAGREVSANSAHFYIAGMADSPSLLYVSS